MGLLSSFLLGILLEYSSICSRNHKSERLSRVGTKAAKIRIKMAKITVTERRRRSVKVVDDNGNTHTGRWNDSGVSHVKGDAMLLAAALSAWTGQVGEWEISAADLALQGGGY